MQANPHTQNPASLTPEYLTPNQLLQRWQVSLMTLRRWRKEGKLRALKIGFSVRIPLAEVIRIETEAKEYGGSLG